VRAYIIFTVVAASRKSKKRKKSYLKKEMRVKNEWAKIKTNCMATNPSAFGAETGIVAKIFL